jgi:small-conductance mechanosensitive channel
MENHVTSVTHVIQLAVAPVFLLTAIATLISSLNVRLGRIVDRQRALQAQAVTAASDVLEAMQREFALLHSRFHLSYVAILAAGVAGLFICLVVALAFIGVLLEMDLSRFLAGFFILAMVSVITSLSLFLREIYLAVSGRERLSALTAADAAPDS